MRPRFVQPGSIAVAVTGLVYFVIVFAFAFVMGIGRAILVAPRLGETAAVLIEIPILVIASWFVARHLVRDRILNFPQLLSIGAIAFTLTMVSEALLAGLIRRQDLAQWAATLVTPLGLIGLGGQLIFAIMPTFCGRRPKDQI